MKNIAYIELDTHAEIALNFYKLIKDSLHVTVDFFFSERICKTLDLQCDNVKISTPELILNQLSVKQYDLVIIGTAHRYFNVFERITEKYSTAIIVHNLNFSQAKFPQILKNIFNKDWKFRLKLLLKENLYRSHQVYQKANYLFVLDKSLADARFQFLPLLFNEFNSEKSISRDLAIAIPGAVSQHRRDYQSILIQLKNLRHFDHNINVVFLGKAQNTELKWLQESENEMPSFINLVYFKEKVSQAIFDDWMQHADFLWCPIQRQTEFLGIEETYTETKMTGNFGDAIKYGKLAIFPSDYQSDFPFLFPEQKDLLKQFLEIKDLTFDFTKDFNQEIVSAQLEKILLSLS
ncbi:hypothetical protein [Chryseobacterium sp. T1]